MAIQAPIRCGCHSHFLLPVFYFPCLNQSSIRQCAVRIELYDFMIGTHGLCIIPVQGICSCQLEI